MREIEMITVTHKDADLGPEADLTEDCFYNLVQFFNWLVANTETARIQYTQSMTFDRLSVPGGIAPEGGKDAG